MSHLLNLLQSDVSCYADFSEPAFAIFRDSAVLQKSLYAQLSPRFGLRVADMRPERGSGNLDDFHLLCTLPRYFAGIRVKIERVEVTCWDSARANQQQFEELVLNTLDAVGRCASIPYRAYTLAVNLHGTVTGVNTQEFLSRFAPSPPKPLGPLAGSGVVFYYGPEADRVSSFLTMDLSGYHAGALYVRMNVVWDAGKIALRDLPRTAEGYVTAMLTAVGLDLPQPAKQS